MPSLQSSRVPLAFPQLHRRRCCDLRGAGRGGGLSKIGVPTNLAVVGGVSFVVVVYIAWAVFTSHSRPAVRQVMEQDVHHMQSARMTTSEIAHRTGLEPHQVRQILAGDDSWWRPSTFRRGTGTADVPPGRG